MVVRGGGLVVRSGSWWFVVVRGGGGGGGGQRLCTKNGPTRVSLSLFPTMAALVWRDRGVGSSYSCWVF